MRRKLRIPKLRDLVDAAAAAIDSIKLNSISVEWYRGHRLRVKRRRPESEYIASLANLFFRAASAHITVRVNAKDWQRGEIDCYRMLNGDQFRAFARGPDIVCQEELPGKSLKKLLASGKLTRRALEAAAREVRRVHRLDSREFGGPWSHGDLHMGNVIYDAATDRARLIDFEIVHDKSLPALSRHADDLLVFLQDMVGLVPSRQWLPFASCFLDTYGRPRVIAELRKLLVVPKGLLGFWWTIRANFCDRAKMRRRFTALRRALDIRAQ